MSDTLIQKQKELENIRKHKLRGQIVRARAKWIEEGEKPSTYFCSLEARNFTSKQIPKKKKEKKRRMESLLINRIKFWKN